jgi:hypothetical protein
MDLIIYNINVILLIIYNINVIIWLDLFSYKILFVTFILKSSTYSVGWCWFVLREEYFWLVAGGWFVLREKYCWLVADKPSEQGASLRPKLGPLWNEGVSKKKV